MLKKFKNWFIFSFMTTKFGMYLKNEIIYPIRIKLIWNKLSKIDYESNQNYKVKQVFNCDFNNRKDLEKWNFAFPWGRRSNGGWITDGENIEIKNSKANFFVEPESGVKTGWWGDYTYHYTTGHLDTKGKFDLREGIVEAKIKLTSKLGFWPAFWMLTETYEHPDSPGIPKEGCQYGESIMPEIDIFEQFGKKGKNQKTQFTLHTGLNYNKPWHKTIKSKIKINLRDKYITYSVKITKEKLSWMINGVVVFEIMQKHLKVHERCHRPMYIILGDGLLSLEHLIKDKEYGMSIDWVKAYEFNEK